MVRAGNGSVYPRFPDPDRLAPSCLLGTTERAPPEVGWSVGASAAEVKAVGPNSASEERRRNKLHGLGLDAHNHKKISS